MKNNDRNGLVITGADDAAARAYDAYVDEFLSYGANLRALFTAADAAPACALLNAHAAVLHLAFEGVEGWALAAPYFERVEQAAQGGLTEREAAFCEAAFAWRAKDFAGALEALNRLTERAPQDLCALKWGQYHAFNLGDQGAMLVLADRVRAAHKNAPYAHGLIAFALEQNHRLEEAACEGERAVQIAPDDAWAHHAVAHVFESEGRSEDGLAWLRAMSDHWDAKGVFIREHNWWHAALFHLALDDREGALRIFDDRLWGEWPEFPQEQIGAVSLLWRLELRGVDVGERWAPVVVEARARLGDHLFPFHDLHYLLALARAGEDGEAADFLASMRRHGEALDGAAKAAWLEACVPCGEALCAFAADDFARAASRLSAAAPALRRIGGSHAQRYMFAETRRNAAVASRARGHAEACEA
ncbi:MAG: tetratricopeptide repeat protein [Pseudomonadota bacterium]